MKLIYSPTEKTTVTTLIITSTMFIPPIVALVVANALCIQIPKYHDNDDPVYHLQQLTKICITNGKNIDDVATLALGLRPRQGVARLWAKGETQESHHMLSKVQRV
jgi:hypothetical protein